VRLHTEIIYITQNNVQGTENEMLKCYEHAAKNGMHMATQLIHWTLTGTCERLTKTTTVTEACITKQKERFLKKICMG
jgi:hypothetical protein